MAHKEKPKAAVTLAAIPAGEALPEKLTSFEIEQLESEAIIYLPAIVNRWLPGGWLSGHHCVSAHPKGEIAVENARVVCWFSMGDSSCLTISAAVLIFSPA